MDAFLQSFTDIILRYVPIKFWLLKFCQDMYSAVLSQNMIDIQSFNDFFFWQYFLIRFWPLKFCEDMHFNLAAISQNLMARNPSRLMLVRMLKLQQLKRLLIEAAQTIYFWSESCYFSLTVYFIHHCCHATFQQLYTQISLKQNMAQGTCTQSSNKGVNRINKQGS